MDVWIVVVLGQCPLKRCDRQIGARHMTDGEQRLVKIASILATAVLRTPVSGIVDQHRKRTERIVECEEFAYVAHANPMVPDGFVGLLPADGKHPLRFPDARKQSILMKLWNRLRYAVSMGLFFAYE